MTLREKIRCADDILEHECLRAIGTGRVVDDGEIPIHRAHILPPQCQVSLREMQVLPHALPTDETLQQESAAVAECQTRRRIRMAVAASNSSTRQAVRIRIIHVIPGIVVVGTYIRAIGGWGEPVMLISQRLGHSLNVRSAIKSKRPVDRLTLRRTNQFGSRPVAGNSLNSAHDVRGDPIAAVDLREV